MIVYIKRVIRYLFLFLTFPAWFTAAATTPPSPAPNEVITFARSLAGTPYRYGCADPSKGFDCSGFVNYVFGHFNIPLPRSSSAFTSVGIEVPLEEALPGDVIVFTGTDHTVRRAGHVGIITESEAGPLAFIHASSGKAHQVTETTLNDYYMRRFLKVIRIIERNTDDDTEDAYLRIEKQ